MSDTDRPLSPTGACLGLPILRTKSSRIVAELERLAIEIRTQQHNINAVVETLAPYATVPDSVFLTTIQIPLGASDFVSAEQLVERMQNENPDIGLDECLREIFMAGMSAMAHRLIPIDEQEHFA